MKNDGTLARTKLIKRRLIDQKSPSSDKGGAWDPQHVVPLRPKVVTEFRALKQWSDNCDQNSAISDDIIPGDEVMKI